MSWKRSTAFIWEKVNRRRHATGTITLCGLLLVTSGCYDAQALIEAHRRAASKQQLQEVDLGTFRISLPQPRQTAEIAEIHFHAFGQVTPKDLQQVRQTIDEDGPDLQHELLLAIRQLGIREIEDPDLTGLRNTIAETLNEQLPGRPVQTVGFYSFGFSNY